MKKEILVVDDQPGIRLLLQEIFTNQGYRVTTAKTGKEALDELNKSSYDLIMLDYKLPVVDGVEVIQQLERDKIEVPAILMSGLAEDIMKESQNYDMVKKVLAKPFNVKDVCDYTKSLIG
ncbi:two-component system, response regulator, stage 0 sporulation protein F [Virgibacillus subterraneus]|uniref:Two-component system, response regulator, stage 0 sporulation protein F n=2 Tax=Virgibacillus TaxID=84406 RepID=A0A1H0YBZ2_9BACI|nr:MULTISPECIES: response regulator [Virgibacillus]SDQ12708.1 two-component system, response regulator, stage 0 sporulation protein F [Virgibacillus salinus]SEP72412.1 two-component system, response regulator, stage 0 sporulation protein F [Virgibacillus subterraneus]